MKGAVLGAALAASLGFAAIRASVGRAGAALDSGHGAALPAAALPPRDDPAQIVAGAMLAIDELVIDKAASDRLAQARAVLIFPSPGFGCAGAGQGLLVTRSAKQWGAPVFVNVADPPACGSGNLVITLSSADAARDLITTGHLQAGGVNWSNDPKDTPVPRHFAIDDGANRSFYGAAASPDIILAGRIPAPDSVAQLTAAFGG